MYHLSSLVGQLKQKEEAFVVAKGYALWLVWEDTLSDTVAQTLSSYGGFAIARETEHALWFFPGEEVFKSLAQIYTWSQIHPLALSVQVFPAKLLVAYDFTIGLAVDKTIVSQKIAVPKELDILVAPQVDVTLRRAPGLHFAPVQREGLSQGQWTRLTVDVGLDYSTSLAWFLIIKPLGNALDRNFVDGWRVYSARLKKLFDQLKIKFLYSEKMEVVLYCKTYQMLQTICLELMGLIDGSDEEVKAWPCIYLGVEKGSLHFSKELSQKIDVSWDYLESDFIHLPLKTVYQLGSPFQPVGTLVPLEKQTGLDSLVKMVLDETGEEGSIGRLKIFLPHHVMDGDNPPCFYCGLCNHPSRECPTRMILSPDVGIHDALAELDPDRLQLALSRIDKMLAENGLEGIKNIIQEKDDASVVMTAFFEINAPCQLRTMRLVWRSKGKDWPRGLKELMPQEDDASWAGLHRLRNGDLATATTHLETFLQNSPRNYKGKTLQGLIAMERGQFKNALGFWKEAEELSFTSLHRSYHMYLRARLHEVMQEYEKAMHLYREAVRMSPAMLEAKYRQAACLLKMGFAEQALGIFLDLIEEDPRVMNMILIDPELERGHLHLMSGLWKPWNKAQKMAKLCIEESEGLRRTVEQWFTSDHPAHDEFKDRLAAMLTHRDKENFVHLVHLARESESLARDIQKRVEKDIQELHINCKNMYNELEKIQKEAGWFPFSKFLRRFNRDFNICLRELNVIGRLNLYHPDSFKKGHVGMIRAGDALDRLREHLKSLVFIRDTTLFMLLFGKNFLWFEVICLILSIVIVPLLIMWGLKTGQPWGYALDAQKWLIYKVVIIVVTICALGGAAVWTTMRFEKNRKKYIQKHIP
ncbi:tetratricopeptide repeat protein [Desulfoplanes sp. PS50]